jgi:hypothetical protein
MRGSVSAERTAWLQEAMVTPRLAFVVAVAFLLMGCSTPAKLDLSSLVKATDAIVVDLDTGRVPSKSALAGAPSTPVDPTEFYALISAAEPRCGWIGFEPHWMGSILVVVNSSSETPEIYRISYYGGFFSKVGVSGYYELPDHLRERWEQLLMQPGALGRIIDQRIARNKLKGTQ